MRGRRRMPSSSQRARPRHKDRRLVPIRFILNLVLPIRGQSPAPRVSHSSCIPHLPPHRSSTARRRKNRTAILNFLASQRASTRRNETDSLRDSNDAVNPWQGNAGQWIIKKIMIPGIDGNKPLARLGLTRTLFSSKKILRSNPKHLPNQLEVVSTPTQRTHVHS